MKTRIKNLWIACSLASSLLLLCLPGTVRAQGYDDVGFWAADLTLNTLQYQATADQLREIQKTYEVLRAGYSIVNVLLNDQNKLHEDFHANMESVSPWVKSSYKTIETVKLVLSEVAILRSESRRLIRLLETSGVFTPAELERITDTFVGMLKKAQNYALDLALVISSESGKGLSMLDSERLKVVDEVNIKVVRLVKDTRSFRNLVLSLAAQRRNVTVDELQTLFSVRP